MFMDDDNYAKPWEVRTFARAMVSGGADILTSFVQVRRKHTHSARHIVWHTTSHTDTSNQTWLDCLLIHTNSVSVYGLPG